MVETVYVLCGISSVICAIMLFRGYLDGRSTLLLWSSFCFGFLALNNVVLVIDVVILPNLDFQGAIWRNGLSALAGSVLMFGLIWELT